MPILKAGEARIHYTLEGQSGTPVLAFSNSLGANYSMWDPQAREFHKKFRVLRYDTRGHGQSSSTPGPYSIELLAKDALALLDAVDLDRVHFCGLSMGGMIGMWLGIKAPERLNKLVLCNTGGKDRYSGRLERPYRSGSQERREVYRIRGCRALVYGRFPPEIPSLDFTNTQNDRGK